MKICIISSRFYPQLVGSGTMIYNIAKSLSANGHEVTALVDESVGDLSTDMKEPYAFNVVFIPGLETYALGKGAMQTPMTAIYQHLSQANYDVIQVCNFMPMLLMNILRPLIRPPVVFSFYNTPNLPKRAIGYYDIPELDIVLASYILRGQGYDKLIVGSQNYFDTAISLGAPLHLTQLSFLGVANEGLGTSPKDTDEEYINEYLGDQLEATDRLIMLPSRITSQKGIVDGVRALKIIRKYHPNTRLLLTGMVKPFDEAYANKVKELSRVEGVDSMVITPKKHIKREHMVSVYRRANVILVPSHYEGLGLSAIEAQMLGRPLVAANAPGLREVAKDNVNALTFNVGDSQGMANAIVRMMDDKILREELTEKAKKDVKRFSLESHVTCLEKTYEDLTSTSQQGRQAHPLKVESIYVEENQ